jgi:hypothetical protein
MGTRDAMSEKGCGDLCLLAFYSLAGLFLLLWCISADSMAAKLHCMQEQAGW